MLQPYHLRNYFNWALPVESFTWADVQQISNFIQFLLAMFRQVRVLWQELADQTVDILVRAPLPRAMRVSEVNRNSCALGDFSMFGHFSALVIRHAFTHR